MSAPIVYDYPLSERLRSLLRLEFLFAQYRHAAAGASSWDGRAALQTLLQIQEYCGRKELKADLGRELRRHADVLGRHRDSPGIDPDALAITLGELRQVAEQLQALQFGDADGTRQQDSFATLRQRFAVAGGACSFDLPGLHHWLQQPAATRADRLDEWLRPLAPLGRAAELILGLLRGSAAARPALASGGFFQPAQDDGHEAQLIRVVVPAEAAWFPEFSGNRRRYSIRFLTQPELGKKPVQVDADVPFRWARCGL